MYNKQYGSWAIGELDYKILKENYSKGNILEFGPGTSTYAFLEGGALSITSYEDNSDFYEKYKKEFASYPNVFICTGSPSPVDNKYDIAFIDGPKGSPSLSRFDSINYAVQYSKLVIVHDSKREGETESINYFSNKGYKVEYIDTEVGMAIIYTQ